MKSAEELRAEARQLCETAEKIIDPALKQELTIRALNLSVRAEAIERSREAPDILRANIARYQNMLSTVIADERQKEIIEEMLRDAEETLAKVTCNP